MAEMQKVCVLEQGVPACEVNLDGPLELGRQRAGEPAPFQLLPASGDSLARLIIAPQHDKDNISRRHLTLTPLPDGRVRVDNHSQAPLERADLDEGAIAAGASADFTPPFALALPGRTISVSPPGSSDPHGVHSLNEPTRGPASASDLSL